MQNVGFIEKFWISVAQMYCSAKTKGIVNWEQIMEIFIFYE